MEQTIPDVYIVIYSSNNADSGNNPNKKQKIQEAELTLAQNIGGLKHSCYTFNGWNTQDDGGGTHYAAADGKGKYYAESDIYTQDKPLTLYAEWTTFIP